MEKHKSNVLTDEELDSLVYLLWSAPVLFSYEGLDDEYTPLVQKGYAYVKEVSAIAPFSICVHITQKGKEAVLREGPIRIITACAREGLLATAERIIKRLPKELLPELLTYDASQQRMYIRLYAANRLEHLNKQEKSKEQGGESMEREKDRTVRLMSCDLTAPEDITSPLLDHNLAWLWCCSYNSGEQRHEIKPEQKMYDFGLDEDVPSDWLVWSEHSDKSISVIHDLRVLQSLGVRGHFIINEVGTMTIEKWSLSDHFIHAHMREVTFEGDPDEIIPSG